MACVLVACTPSARPEALPRAEAPHDEAGAAEDREQPDVSPTDASIDSGALPAVTAPVDAGDGSDRARPPTASAPTKGTSPASPASASASVKVVTIGMHVGGGPFDEATKQPFKRAVEPHFPEFVECWTTHVASSPTQADVGVDLLIESSGGKPNVSNPRSTLPKDASQAVVPCIVSVFESVEFPKLDRGRTGVSYSLRFTRR